MELKANQVGVYDTSGSIKTYKILTLLDDRSKKYEKSSGSIEIFFGDAL